MGLYDNPTGFRVYCLSFSLLHFTLSLPSSTSLLDFTPTFHSYIPLLSSYILSSYIKYYKLRQRYLFCCLPFLVLSAILIARKSIITINSFCFTEFIISDLAGLIRRRSGTLHYLGLCV
jgi:hypothetical protein